MVPDNDLVLICAGAVGEATLDGSFDVAFPPFFFLESNSGSFGGSTSGTEALVVVLRPHDVLLESPNPNPEPDPNPTEGEGSALVPDSDLVLICAGGVAVATGPGSSGAAERSPNIDGSRVFSFGVAAFGVAALTETGWDVLIVSTRGDADTDAAADLVEWDGLMVSTRGDADADTAADLVGGPHKSVSVSPSLLVALMVLDTGGAPKSVKVLVVLDTGGGPKSVKPLVVLSRSLPFSFAVYGSMVRSLPLRLRPLSLSASGIGAIGAEDDIDKPRDPVRSRSNPRVVSAMLGAPMIDSALGNSTTEPILLVGAPEVKEAGECPRDVIRDCAALVKSSSATLSDSSSSPRDPLSL